MNPDQSYEYPSEEREPRDYLRNLRWPPPLSTHWASEYPMLHQAEWSSSPGDYSTPPSDGGFTGGRDYSESPVYQGPEPPVPYFQGNWRPIPRSMSVSALPTSFPSSGACRNETPAPAPLRQIRFVTNDGQPHTKRRRINAACQNCRKRKTRCSGERPACKTCSENGQICGGYPELPQQHGLQRIPSIDTLSTRENDDDDCSPTSPTKPSSRHFSFGEARKLSKDGHSTRGHMQQPTLLEETQSAIDAAALIKDQDIDQAADDKSPASSHSSASLHATRNRVPYFRYFGPTAIVPGSRPMVLEAEQQRHSFTSLITGSSITNAAVVTGIAGISDSTSTTGGDLKAGAEIRFYDPTDALPNSPVVSHLCETFFTHLGCNYPFLQRERFLRDLSEKQVNTILVDAVCAVAARFSTHPLLSPPTPDTVSGDAENQAKAFQGQPFAQRAMAAVVDTFPCPTIAVAQACLLLAYEEFGSDRDSGLWMYLGTSIRMAQDLGMQKLEGMQFEGRMGPTPKTTKKGLDGKEEELKREEQQLRLTAANTQSETASIDSRRASEQERIDTFYCIFFLDRVVSSGTGRPVTLRDKDIEISFPHELDDQTVDGWPQPFPPLIRVVHLYGRVTDTLKDIGTASQVTPETMSRLAGMERDLTGIHERLSPKLHFNAANFQHYVKVGQGTNFVLLHLWFHTLIVMLHQPTLLLSWKGSIEQLFPDSRELSMSSAKTIADILAFAELIDARSFIGNAFTSQPMYVAACAFLKEAAAHASQPPSRAVSPPSTAAVQKRQTEAPEPSKKQSGLDQRRATRDSLPASVVNQNYQRCYRSLKTLEVYWAGTRYLTAILDQKAQGIMDPGLFKSEDVDTVMPSTEPDFSASGWRRSASHNGWLGATPAAATFSCLKYWDRSGSAWSSPSVDPSQAIGWSLAGTTHSPNPNLSFLYRNPSGEVTGKLLPQPNLLMRNHPAPTLLPFEAASAAASEAVDPSHVTNGGGGPSVSQVHVHDEQRTMLDRILAPVSPSSSSFPADAASMAEADLLLGLQTSYGGINGQNVETRRSIFDGSALSPQPTDSLVSRGWGNTPVAGNHTSTEGNPVSAMTSVANTAAPLGNLMIESQDIDMSAPQSGISFAGCDMVPWLEYLPQDILHYFGDQADHGGMMDPAAS